MALALPVVIAIPLGFALGGRLRGIAELRLRSTWLFFIAIALQVVAFPVGVMPWRIGDRGATLLWIASYGVLIAGALVNRHVRGVPIVAAGMAANVVAIVANGGTMPVLPGAMRAAGDEYLSQANSTAVSDPHLSWLVDRWAAHDWIPFANVFSVGDVLIAVGAVVIVLAAMDVRLPTLAGRSTSSSNVEN
jgi:hypothetical protein